MQKLEQLCVTLASLRNEREAINAKIVEIEEQITPLVETPEEGSKTLKLTNGLKVTVERGYNYRVKAKEMLEALGDDAPLRVKMELDKTAYRKLKDTDPVGFMQAAEFVTATPKKTSVTLGVL